MVLKLKYGFLYLALCVAVAVMGIAKLSTAAVKTAAVPEKTALPVVMYHQITKNSARAGKYCVTLSELENDLAYLKEKGYEDIEIVNKERQFTFKYEENTFEITLIQKRKGKT